MKIMFQVSKLFFIQNLENALYPKDIIMIKLEFGLQRIINKKIQENKIVHINYK